SETTATVETFIVKWHGIDVGCNVLVELSRFKAMVKSLESSRRLELCNSSKILVVDFWSGIEGYPPFQAVAVMSFNSVCSSAASERNLSTHKFFHSTLRNPLKTISVEMLVHLSFNARNVDITELTFLDEFVAVTEPEEPESRNLCSDYVYY
ncbi:Transposase, partial [Phytophthora megakarya]